MTNRKYSLIFAFTTALLIALCALAVFYLKINTLTGFILFFASQFLIFFGLLYFFTKRFFRKQNPPNRKQVSEIKQLRKREIYRREFIGNVSHELKTPIFNIQGYILTLLDGGLKDENVNKKYLKKAKKNIKRMINIIEDLDVITKLESGEIELKMQKFNLIDVIEDVIEEHEIKAKEQNIGLRLLAPSSKLVMVHSNLKSIHQILNNLIHNSIKYGKNEGVTEINVREQADKIFVEVIDDGVGISKEKVPRIFERFYRIDESRSKNIEGTGLGLAIVKHMIETLGQKIEVKSTLDKGTTFTFTLDKAT